MGRHEIRLRRKTMTSRRIQRHKNYTGLLEQHKKTQRTRSIVRWVVYVLMFLIGMMMVYYAVEKAGAHKKNTKDKMSIVVSKPSASLKAKT